MAPSLRDAGTLTARSARYRGRTLLEPDTVFAGTPTARSKRYRSADFRCSRRDRRNPLPPARPRRRGLPDRAQRIRHRPHPAASPLDRRATTKAGGCSGRRRSRSRSRSPVCRNTKQIQSRIIQSRSAGYVANDGRRATTRRARCDGRRATGDGRLVYS